MSVLDAIIFDFDGVIANSERLHLVAFQQTIIDQRQVDRQRRVVCAAGREADAGGDQAEVTGFRHGYVQRVASAVPPGRRASGVPP